MMKRKSQIFLFDLILSITILIVSIGLVSIYYSNTLDNQDIYSANLNFIQSFTKTNINSLNNEDIRIFFTSNKIKNIENTLAQQVSEFYFNGNNIDAQNLTQIIARDYFSRQMNVKITLIDGLDNLIIFEQYSKNKKEASLVSEFQREVFGFYENKPFGPYLIISEVWI